jgi:hypothetical protein
MPYIRDGLDFLPFALQKAKSQDRPYTWREDDKS